VLHQTRLAEITAKQELELVKRETGFMQSQRILPEETLLERIQRYESHLFKHFFQTLHELQRIQASRLGASIPVPTIVDVNISNQSIS
jgi:hypothetical protein